MEPDRPEWTPATWFPGPATSEMGMTPLIAGHRENPEKMGVAGLVFHGLVVCLWWGLASHAAALYSQQHLGCRAVFSLTGRPSPADSKAGFRVLTGTTVGL